jgi:hypothetical protein
MAIFLFLYFPIPIFLFSLVDMVVYLAYLEAGEEETTSFEKGECHCGV